jgi:hypothetical protein
MVEVAMGHQGRARPQLTLALLLLTLAPLSALAQPAEEDRRSIRIAAGVVSQQGTFGDDHPLAAKSQIGSTFSLAIRRHPMRRLGLAFEAALEPTPIRNPHFDESVSRLYVQIGSEIGRRIYVRPTIGGAINAWSGRFSSGGLSLAPAATLAVGYRQTIGEGWQLQPEFVARATAEIGAFTRSLGMQIAVSHRRW